MEQPKPFECVNDHRTFFVKSPKEIKTVQGIECFDGGDIKVNGKSMRLMVRIDGKPEFSQKVADWRAEWATYDAWKREEFDRNVPGYRELEQASDAAAEVEYRYRSEVNRRMDDEQLSSFSPAKPDNAPAEKAAVLRTQYPRATVYLRAKRYTNSDNLNKYSAGKKAMEIIATGGSIEDAKYILDNWSN